MKESKLGMVILFSILSILILLSYENRVKHIVKEDHIEKYHYYCDDEKLKQTVTFCNIDITGLPGTDDTLTEFYGLLNSDYLYNMPLYVPIILIVLSLYSINRILKSKYLYYYTQRKKYEKFLKSMILSAYKYVLAVPFMIILLYLLSFTISNHGPNPLCLAMWTSKFSLIHYETPGFLILYTIHIMLRWLVIINIGLIVQSRNHKMIFTLIESIIIYFIIDIISENFPICFWTMGFYTVNDYSIYIYVIISLVYFIISFIGVLFAYKNKEKMLKRIGV